MDFIADIKNDNWTDTSKVWIYQSNRPLKNIESEQIKKEIDSFCQGWQAHGKLLRSKGGVAYNQFILFIVDESLISASGCAIDSSVHFIRKISTAYGLDFFDRWHIAYKTAEAEISGVNKMTFQKLLTDGIITKDTIVFNNTVNTKGALLNHWEVPLYKSWHMRFFDMP